MTEIGLVHLVRAANGLAPFQEFLQAYGKNRGGLEHDLIFVFKGFPRNELAFEFRQAADTFPHQRLFTHDGGLDLRSYRLAAQSLNYPYFCFLNSFSLPLDPEWLAKLSAHIHRPGVGLAGASGSWESMYSNLFVPLPPGTEVTLLDHLWRPFRVQLCKRCFEPFPNWHLRTNALLVSRELVLQLWPQSVLTKRNAYLFENGKRNLTRQVLQMGLEVLVVGKDGHAYRKEEWPKSKTYRSGNQVNLLVADTQTRRFENADLPMKSYLARVAWGDAADV